MLHPVAGRDPMRDNKPKKTTSLKTDRRIADSIAFVPLANEHLFSFMKKTMRCSMEMEMDSHGGLEVTIRQTE